VHNSSIPTLPVEDNSVDCIAAWSVFTHIETFELHWLAELRRILRPGGLALLTFVTDRHLRVMTPDWPMRDAFVGHPRWSERMPDEVAERGKGVFRWHGDRSYTSNVVYGERFLADMLRRHFDIAEWKHQFPLYQDLLALKKA